MGNEHSQLPGIDIEDKAIVVSNLWSHHSAKIFGSDNVTNLSVFIGELFVKNSFWSPETPLQKSTKNLMVYRHPCILKYISSWQNHLKYYSAVEDVKPLSQVITNLDNLQISVGLYSILKALHFLHENAFASHNNVCLSSIYVTKDGNWKLGGMEFLCKYKDLAADYLSKSRPNRYTKAIDINEHKVVSFERKDFVDVYAFGVLVAEILKSKAGDDAIDAFCNYCRTELQNPDVSKRPNFESISKHVFFNQDFIMIHSFLVELPLKTDQEKTEFFENLAERLTAFDEILVASQLSGLLLSRMVLLDSTAQTELLPLLLSPKPGTETNQRSNSLFSVQTFRTYLCPKLIEIFKVRDVQIRLLLLNHFHNFVHQFTKEELQSHVLPELLVGIKDTNDHLVSVTLRSLADLVSILGAATVIGGKRAKLFNDGRPMHFIKMIKSNKASELTPMRVADIISDSVKIVLRSADTESNELPERPRPDGEEEENSAEEVEQSVDEDLETWDDWDLNESNQISGSSHIVIPRVDNVENTEKESVMPVDSSNSKKALPNILDLDIKNQLRSNENEFDFFQDMEPVINNSNKFIVNENKIDASLEREISRKLALNVDNSNEDGWESGDWE